MSLESQCSTAAGNLGHRFLGGAEGNFSGQVPTTWPEQAGMAVAGDWDKLEKWQDELDGGKPPADKA